MVIVNTSSKGMWFCDIEKKSSSSSSSEDDDEGIDTMEGVGDGAGPFSSDAAPRSSGM